VRFEFITKHLVEFSVAQLCALLGVSREGFYAWQRRGASRRERENGRLLVLIRSIFKRSRGTYGTPRVHAELVAMGEKVGRNRVARLMAKDGLIGRSPRRRISTTKARPGVVGENLLDRQFTVDAPNVTDRPTPGESDRCRPARTSSTGRACTRSPGGSDGPQPNGKT
jgi:putative transposase